MKEEFSDKYRRPDVEGGFITDRDEIDYYRAVQKNDVIDNHMLGDFNMVGTYVINKAIVEELIEMPKVIEEVQEDSIFCQSRDVIKDRHIHFVIKLTNNASQSGNVNATLELLEEIERANGYYKNTNTVMIETYETRSGVKSNAMIFEYFNINEDDESGAEKEKYDYQHIIDRFDYLNYLDRDTNGLNNKAQKDLYESRMKYLSSKPSCNVIIEQFNKQVFHINGKFIKKGDKDFYKYLNQILDGILETYDYELSAEDIRELKKKKKQYADFSNACFEQFQRRIDQQIAVATMKQHNKQLNELQKILAQEKQQQNLIANKPQEVKQDKPQEVKQDKQSNNNSSVMPHNNNAEVKNNPTQTQEVKSKNDLMPSPLTEEVNARAGMVVNNATYVVSNEKEVTYDKKTGTLTVEQTTTVSKVSIIEEEL